MEGDTTDNEWQEWLDEQNKVRYCPECGGETCGRCV